MNNGITSCTHPHEAAPPAPRGGGHLQLHRLRLQGGGRRPGEAGRAGAGGVGPLGGGGDVSGPLHRLGARSPGGLGSRPGPGFGAHLDRGGSCSGPGPAHRSSPGSRPDRRSRSPGPGRGTGLCSHRGRGSRGQRASSWGSAGRARGRMVSDGGGGLRPGCIKNGSECTK